MNTLHRSTLLAVAGTALALSLTACQSDSGSTSSSRPTTAATVASSPAAGATTAAKGTVTSDAAGPAASARSAGSKDSTGATDAAGGRGTASTLLCTARDVRVTAATQDGPPYTHIVLTARNTSGHSCRLAGFPHLQFLESHKQDVPAVAKSKPATPVVLSAGAPAYALVKLSDGGVDEDNEPVSAFSLQLEGDSTVIAVTAPGSDGIAVDPAKALTGYWTPELRNGADDF
ncbi:DUF4232 domain-containing protein [Streptomyces longwoodensis]|uniref:DUF4232 domain-containing protein n=1 Tax=Streptomyces longwoodensis TaxID=68231 RepID=UPI002259B9BE|nr:DUF4232 domain-containing protein [Streptomyces longwoodensis]MCX4996589.1 DUF4232 domain-containing protein [Streptomyces longwoodensis]WTI44430.1 DUF4232 domain-containing protein [Streptomyces longwoodensis]WUC57227.1 DUF4232 domain-containing protein [Streptomyces longwoodensis]WUC70727.1 DUF4232 domain-containing protein [Streptomyces longwoodensis]